VTADLGLFLGASLDGSVDFTLPLTLGVSGSAKTECRLDGQFPYMVPTAFARSGSSDFSIELSPSFNGEVVFKPKLFLGGEVTIAGVKITKFEAGGGPYLSLSGTVSGTISYASSTGEITPSWEASASGELGAFVSIGGEILDGKWSVTILEWSKPLYAFLDLSTADESSSRALPSQGIAPGAI
jgi:hypothetical protein